MSIINEFFFSFRDGDLFERKDIQRVIKLSRGGNTESLAGKMDAILLSDNLKPDWDAALSILIQNSPEFAEIALMIRNSCFKPDCALRRLRRGMTAEPSENVPSVISEQNFSTEKDRTGRASR